MSHGHDRQSNEGESIDERRRTLLKLPALGILASSAFGAAGVAEAASSVQITKEDLTGDGTDDIRLENSEIFIQMNGEDLESLNIAMEGGHQGGADVTGEIQTRPQSPISFTDSPPAQFKSLTSFDIVEDSSSVGSYKIVREYNLFGDSQDDEIPIEIDAHVRLFQGDPFVLIELTYENLGSKAVKFDQDDADIHDGFQVLVRNDLVGRSDSDPDYRFHLPGQGTRTFDSVFTFQKFPGTDWATIFDDQDASTYGRIDGHTAPKEWVNVPQDALDYQLDEFWLDPGQSVSYTLVVGIHDGGTNAPTVGEQIYDTATDRATGELLDLQPFIDLKQEKIDTIQNLAGTQIGVDEAEERVDQKAQALLNQIEANRPSASNRELKQFEEALKRMNAAEEITEVSTLEAVKGDGLVERTSVNLVSAATTIATELINFVGGSLLRKAFNWLMDRVHGIVWGIIDAIRGAGVVDTEVSETILEQVRRIQTEHFFTMKALPDSDLADVSEEFANEGITKAKETADDLGITDSLDDSVADIVDELKGIPFEQLYYFSEDDELPDLHIPNEIDIPDLHFEIDLPDELLPWWVNNILPIPDRIVLDLPSEDLNLDQFLPAIDDINDIRQSVAIGDDDIGGINTTIDDRMESLDEEIGNLSSQDDNVRETVKAVLEDGIEDISALANEIMEALELIEEIFTEAERIATALKIAGIAGAAVLFLSPLSALTLLALVVAAGKAAAVFGAARKLLDIFEIAVGVGSLSYMATGHHVGTGAIVNSDLGGVNLD